MATVIKDTIGLCQQLTPQETATCHKYGLPVFKGVLYKQLLDDNGEPILKKINENTVTLGGAVLALQKLFGVPPKFVPKTVNELEGINKNAPYNNEGTYIKCFGAGVEGCGDTIGSVNDPDFKDNQLNGWIPFRISNTDKLPDSISDKYFFRKKIGPDSDPQWGWYLKEFENTVTPSSYWKDTPDPNSLGTEVLSEVAGSSNQNLIECFGECILKIEEDDLRPYFQWAGDLKIARYNSFGLFTGIKREITPGYIDYAGVRLFSLVNFNNVSLDMPTTATYLYRVYAAV